MRGQRNERWGRFYNCHIYYENLNIMGGKAPVTFYSLTLYSLLRARKIRRGEVFNINVARAGEPDTSGHANPCSFTSRSLKRFLFLPKPLIFTGKIIYSQPFFLEGHQIEFQKHSFNNMQEVRLEALKIQGLFSLKTILHTPATWSSWNLSISMSSSPSRTNDHPFLFTVLN